MEKIYLLVDEYENLLLKKQQLHNEMEEIGKIIWEVTNQWETWHDNAWFDEATRTMHLAVLRSSEINKIINLACIINGADNRESISIWSKVEIELNGLKKEIALGGYSTFPDRVAYNSLLWKTLLWKKPWDKLEYSINWKVHTWSIIQFI